MKRPPLFIIIICDRMNIVGLQVPPRGRIGNRVKVSSGPATVRAEPYSGMPLGDCPGRLSSGDEAEPGDLPVNPLPVRDGKAHSSFEL